MPNENEHESDNAGHICPDCNTAHAYPYLMLITPNVYDLMMVLGQIYSCDTALNN